MKLKLSIASALLGALVAASGQATGGGGTGGGAADGAAAGAGDGGPANEQQAGGTAAVGQGNTSDGAAAGDGGTAAAGQGNTAGGAAAEDDGTGYAAQGEAPETTRQGEAASEAEAADQPGQEDEEEAGMGTPGAAGAEDDQARDAGAGAAVSPDSPDSPGAYWSAGEGEPVEIDSIDPRVRTAMENTAGRGEISNISRVSIGGREVYRALAREPLAAGNSRDRYLFVDAAGDVLKVQEPLDAAEAPQAIRVVAERLQQGATGSSLLREESSGSTHYVMRVSREERPDQWFRMDQAGNILETTDTGEER